MGQLPYDDEVCPGKSPRQLKLEDDKKKLLNGLNKTLIYISYLSYSDRTVDRPLTGPDEYEPYRGKMIRNIEVRILQPYGVTIDKPVTDRYTRFQKFANRIQIRTKEWVVRNDLLFKSGDIVDPILFSDTERNLWERKTFKDLKIFIEPVDGSEELIDVVIILQDRWSWGLMTSLQYTKISAGIEFKNFLGLPQSISNYVSFNYRKDNLYTVFGAYTYENIRRSHIDAKLYYQYDNLSKGGEIRIKRDFFSANSKWAGHIKGAIYKESAAVPNDWGAAIPTRTTYNWQDIWLATSFKLPGKFGEKYDLLRAVISGRMNRYQYLERPYLRSPDGSQVFINRTYFLGSVGLANWDYYVDHSVYYLDQAEYFGKGFNPALILGFDYDEELQKRFYSGLQMDYAKYFKRFGYFDIRASYGGFTKKNSYQQMLFRITNNFYSSAVKLGRKFMMRQFVSVTANLGFNRPLGKEIAMNNYNGVRGIFIDYIRGTRSYVFNFETDVYPTFKVLGFSSSVFAFADIAIVQQNSLTSFQLSQGYGVGLRLRNLAMGIGSFEITVAYYPRLDIPGIKQYSVMGSFENSRAIRADNLFVPTILSPDFRKSFE
jgi:hypothetical protein